MEVEKVQLDAVYSVGFKNGQIEMRNKVLKSINHDWSLLPDADLVLKILLKINKLRLSKPNLTNPQE